MIERMLAHVEKFWTGEKTYQDVVAFSEYAIRQLKISYDPTWSEKPLDELKT